MQFSAAMCLVAVLYGTIQHLPVMSDWLNGAGMYVFHESCNIALTDMLFTAGWIVVLHHFVHFVISSFAESELYDGWRVE